MAIKAKFTFSEEVQKLHEIIELKDALASRMEDDQIFGLLTPEERQEIITDTLHSALRYHAKNAAHTAMQEILYGKEEGSTECTK